jgi:WhiB family redox-sensing transcriptional regulator
MPGSAARRAKAAEDDAVNDDSPWHQASRLRPNWRQAAACRDTDPDLFFPIGSSGPAVSQVAEAKQVCDSCPVRTPCLGWALRHWQNHGIWGGMTEPERETLRAALSPRQRRPA